MEILLTGDLGRAMVDLERALDEFLILVQTPKVHPEAHHFEIDLAKLEIGDELTLFHNDWRVSLTVTAVGTLIPNP